MTAPLEPAAMLAGRILLASIYLASAGANLADYTLRSDELSEAGLPCAVLVLTVAILFEIVGATSLLVGIKTRPGAVLLLVISLGSLLWSNIIHPTDGASPLTRHALFESLATTAGLLFLLARGPGGWSYDEWHPVAPHLGDSNVLS